jgi:ABC-type Fe3+ transport system permease subunit
VFTETLLLAPIAVLLWLMLAARRPGEKLHLARMAGSRRLIWDLALEPRAAALGLLFLLSYFEFTAASILAPVQLTPVFVRLHNLAHYGQTSALSAMLFSAVLAPVVVLALTLGGARFYARRDAR